MPLPLATITHIRTSFSPFHRAARTCRLVLSLLQTPSTTNPSSPSHIEIAAQRLPRAAASNTAVQPEIVVGFKSKEEVKFEVGRLGLKAKDVVEEISRIGRKIEREESLKG